MYAPEEEEGMVQYCAVGLDQCRTGWKGGETPVAKPEVVPRLEGGMYPWMDRVEKNEVSRVGEGLAPVLEGVSRLGR